MLLKPSSVQERGKKTIFTYNDRELAEIKDGIEMFFNNRKYRLESGTNIDGEYGTGSNLKRILFGAFAKRYVFSVHISSSNDSDGKDTVTLKVGKAISGVVGGVIGYRKMNNEYRAIIDELKAGFS